MRHRTLVSLLGAVTAVALSAGGGHPAQVRAAGPTQHGGVVLDKFGGLHPFGGANVDTRNAPYWGGSNIARSAVVLPDGSGGWTLDDWGGIHNWGAAPAIATPSYWPGWDIARALVVLPDEASGYVLDGWGTLHAFGAAPALSITYWPRWDIARGVDVRLDAQNAVIGAAVLDAWGGVHATGSYASGGPPMYPGWDAYHSLHSVGGSSYAVAQFGVVSIIDGALHPYWAGYPDFGAWNVEQDVVLLGGDNPSPTGQPLSPWTYNQFRAATGQLYDVSYVPGCAIPNAAHFAAAQVIIVSVECQRLTAYQNGQPILNVAVTTARPGRVTPHGWHQILSKRSPAAVLMNVTWGPVMAVQYAMAFDNIGDIFHDASWEPLWAYGLASSLNPPYGSHGCVHVPAQQLGALFAWARLGASVYIN
jgi:hypothetical protein